jgi:hypothetical protein
MKLILDDGRTVELQQNPHGWYASHDGGRVRVTIIGDSTARSPAKCRWAPIERAVLA